MWTSLLHYITRRGSDPPPLYQTIDPLLEPPSPSPSEEDGSAIEALNQTPRAFFDYHVKRRKSQQLEAWSRTYMDRTFYGDAESQNILARDWVVKQWQNHGIWACTWPVTGPGLEEKWECGDPDGIPDCLFYMELVWEMQHIMLVQNPVFIPCLAKAQARLPSVMPPTTVKPGDLCYMALSELLERWERKGFSSCTIQQSTWVYRRDLGELHEWLPRPARDALDSLNVTRWHDLLRGWEDKIGDLTTDLFGFALPPGSRENAIAAIRDAQAESLRVEARRQISPLQAPAAHQHVREIPTEAGTRPRTRRPTRRSRRNNATRPSVRDEAMARPSAAARAAATANGMQSSGNIASRRQPLRAQGRNRRRAA